VKRHSTELAILQALNLDDIRNDPWNPAPRLLYTAERGEDVILCFEHLFDCDDPPMQTVANMIDYIRQALEVSPVQLLQLAPAVLLYMQGLCFLHEQKIVHLAYGEPNSVMMDIGRPNTASFDRTQLPVRYYRVNFTRAQQLSQEADPRGASFRRDVSDCGSMLQMLVQGVGFSCSLGYNRVYLWVSPKPVRIDTGTEDWRQAALACWGHDKW
jgi:hypothetical protein